MKYPCEEQLRCRYGGTVDTEGDKAYILKEVNGKTIAWHYMCRVKEDTELLKMPIIETAELKYYLMTAWEDKKNDKPYWVDRILQSL